MDCFHCFQVSLQPYRLYQSNHVFFPQLRSYIEVLFLSLTSGNSKGIQMIGKKHSWRFFGLQGRKREKTRGQLDTFFCCSVGCCSTCHILSITFHAFYFDESCVSLPGAFVGIHRADLKKRLSKSELALFVLHLVDRCPQCAWVMAMTVAPSPWPWENWVFNLHCTRCKQGKLPSSIPTL